jgi:hypothetical protein
MTENEIEHQDIEHNSKHGESNKAWEIYPREKDAKKHQEPQKIDMEKNPKEQFSELWTP